MIPSRSPIVSASAIRIAAQKIGDEFLTPGDVALMFKVDPKTVTRWAAAGKLASIRTPGNHRRFRKADVLALFNGEGQADR